MLNHLVCASQLRAATEHDTEASSEEERIMVRVRSDELIGLVQNALKGEPLNPADVHDMVELIIALLALSDLPRILPDTLPGTQLSDSEDFSELSGEAE